MEHENRNISLHFDPDFFLQSETRNKKRHWHCKKTIQDQKSPRYSDFQAGHAAIRNSVIMTNTCKISNGQWQIYRQQAGNLENLFEPDFWSGKSTKKKWGRVLMKLEVEIEIEVNFIFEKWSFCFSVSCRKRGITNRPETIKYKNTNPPTKSSPNGWKVDRERSNAPERAYESCSQSVIHRVPWFGLNTWGTSKVFLLFVWIRYAKDKLNRTHLVEKLPNTYN